MDMDRASIACRYMYSMVFVTIVGCSISGASAEVEMDVIEIRGRADGSSGYLTGISPSSSEIIPDRLIKDLDFKDLRKISQLSPNVSSSQSDSARAATFTIRGSQELTFHELGGGRTSAAYYIDDIPFLDAYGRGFGMFSANGMTLHKGPHGTMFGAPGPLGTFETTTRRPGSELAGEASYTYGSDEFHQGEVHAGGQIVPGLLFGVDIQYAESEGWYRDRLTGNPYGATEGISALAKLIWQPTEKLELTLTAGLEHHNDDPAVYLPFDGSHSYTVSADPAASSTGWQAFQALRAVWKEEDWQLKSITSHRYTDFEDYDGALLGEVLPPLLRDRDQEVTAWTQEIRAESTNPDADWQWRAGVFFADRSTRLDHFILGLGPWEGSNTMRYDFEEWAAYGETTRKLGPHLELSGGLRLQRSRDHTRSTFDPTPFAGSLGGVAFGTDDSKDFTAALPMAAIAWKWTDQQRSYFRFSTAMQPGGLAVAAGGTGDYAEQRSFHYELGHDSSFQDGRVTLHSAAFYTDYQDYQAFQFHPAGQTIYNTEAHAWGLESELRWSVTEELELYAGAGYTQSRYDDFDLPGGNLRGKRIPSVPSFTFNAGASYRAKWGGVAAINWRMTGSTPLDDTNTFTQGTYSLVDGRIGFEKGNFGIYLFGRNLGDTGYFTHSYVYFGRPAAVPGNPRMIGTEIRVTF